MEVCDNIMVYKVFVKWIVLFVVVIGEYLVVGGVFFLGVVIMFCYIYKVVKVFM